MWILAPGSLLSPPEGSTGVVLPVYQGVDWLACKSILVEPLDSLVVLAYNGLRPTVSVLWIPSKGPIHSYWVHLSTFNKVPWVVSPARVPYCNQFLNLYRNPLGFQNPLAIKKFHKEQFGILSPRIENAAKILATHKAAEIWTAQIQPFALNEIRTRSVAALIQPLKRQNDKGTFWLRLTCTLAPATQIQGIVEEWTSHPPGSQNGTHQIKCGIRVQPSILKDWIESAHLGEEVVMSQEDFEILYLEPIPSTLEEQKLCPGNVQGLPGWYCSYRVKGIESTQTRSQIHQLPGIADLPRVMNMTQDPEDHLRYL